MLNTGAANNATTFGVLIVLCPYIRIQLADDDKTLSVVMGMCRLKITHHIKLGTSLCAPRVGHNCVYVILGESWIKSHRVALINLCYHAVKLQNPKPSALNCGCAKQYRCPYIHSPTGC